MQQEEESTTDGENGQGTPPAQSWDSYAAPSAEDRETLKFLSSVLAEEGREAARELLREIVAGLAEPAAGEEAAHVAFLLALDLTADELGSLEESRRLCERVLAITTRLLPADHSDVLFAKLNHAVILKWLGDLAGAKELEEAVHESWTRLLPPDHPDLLAAKLNLARTKRKLGDLGGARELEEAVLEACTRRIPSDHLVLRAKRGLAATRLELGDLQGARELGEGVHEAYTRLLPPDHPELLWAKQDLANTRKELGDLQGARELEEAVLEARMRLLPPDHPELLGMKLNLAATRKALGDLQGARELEEAVLETRTLFLSSDHPELLRAKNNLANTREALGDVAGAHDLLEAVHEAWTRLLPPDHAYLLGAKLNLAGTRKELGDLAGAKELEEAVLVARMHLLPPDAPGVLKVKLNLALTRSALGDVAGAKELGEAVHEAWTRLLPSDHPLLLAAKQNLGWTRYALGDLDGTNELVASLLACMRRRAGVLRSEAARPAREGARAELERLSAALFLSAALDSQRLAPELFATLENLRLASVASAEAAHVLADRPELAAEVRRIAALRSELNDLVAAGPADSAAAGSWRAELVRLTEERDRTERGLKSSLAGTGAFAGEIEAKTVGAQLRSDAAAAAFLRYRKYSEPAVDSLLAFVVSSDGSVRRIELGPAAEVEALVQEWRADLGRPLEARGAAGTATSSPATELAEIGKRLREHVLDPVLAAAGETRTLHVVLDDVLYLVPLDALPLEEGIVGERIAIRNEVTLARLLRPAREVSSEGGLLLAGGIDYDEELGAGSIVRLDASTPPVEGGLRSGAAAAGFVALPGARAEAESISALFTAAFEREASVLVQAAATKAALFAAAPRARWLHLATHGWFASEAFRSQLDSLAEQGSRDALQRAQETLTGFAPETLCGLALAGANRGKDALGRVPGILTAEELATFDLRNCELAVLSACETNVGIRRAGQGIQSLQTALHAAGARTAITSLWKVDDAATRRLFELFYTKLWKDKLGKADALWQAKMALRAEGHPPRDWAGWILTGDPR